MHSLLAGCALGLALTLAHAEQTPGGTWQAQEPLDGTQRWHNPDGTRLSFSQQSSDAADAGSELANNLNRLASIYHGCTIPARGEGPGSWHWAALRAQWNGVFFEQRIWVRLLAGQAEAWCLSSSQPLTPEQIEQVGTFLAQTPPP